MAKSKTPKSTVRVVDHSKKCMVCNGPYRVPSWFEMQGVEGAVENAQAAADNIKARLWGMLDNPQHGTHEVQAEIEKLAEANRFLGKAEQTLAVVEPCTR